MTLCSPSSKLPVSHIRLPRILFLYATAEQDVPSGKPPGEDEVTVSSFRDLTMLGTSYLSWGMPQHCPID
jgi:hypothetical protein